MIIAILTLLGLCLGSFTNAFVWRLHEQSKKGAKKNKDLSITKGRSMCPNCKHALGLADLIPVLSWLSLRGKCRYCHKPISIQYPLVELLMALLFVVSYMWWPYGFELAGIVQYIFWLPSLVILMSLLIYDLKWMLLPNRLVWPFVWFTAVNAGLQIILRHDINLIFQAFWGVVCLAGLFYVIFQLSKGRWIGGGDVKLAIALGLLVGGPLKAFLLLFVASVIGVLVTIPLLAKKQKKMTSQIPFGPFLIIGTFVVYLFGSSIVSWYLHSLLHL